MIKKTIIVICSFLLTCNVFAAPKSHAQSLDGIVAIVDDSVITQSELNNALQTARKQLSASNTPAPAADVLRKQVLNQLIDRKLQFELAEQAGIKVTDEQITAAISRIAEQNKLSVKEIMDKVASQGMNAEAYRKEIREELLIQQVQQQEVGSHITVVPQEIEDMLRSAGYKAFNNKEYHLEDILIALPDSPSSSDIAAAKKQADELLKKIHKGTSFGEVAAAESSNSQALQGGDMGWLKLPQIPPAFSEQLVHMKANDILGPVATPNGFHIIRLVETRDIASTKNSPEQSKQVEQLLFQRKFEEGLQNWIAKLHSEAYININPSN